MPRRSIRALALASSARSSSSLSHSPTRGTASAEQVLTVPAGFAVERVAGPPLVNRPIVADFDDQGPLYVTDSSGSNARAEKQLADNPTASSAWNTRMATGVLTGASSSPTR